MFRIPSKACLKGAFAEHVRLECRAPNQGWRAACTTVVWIILLQLSSWIFLFTLKVTPSPNTHCEDAIKVQFLPVCFQIFMITKKRLCMNLCSVMQLCQRNKFIPVSATVIKVSTRSSFSSLMNIKSFEIPTKSSLSKRRIARFYRVAQWMTAKRMFSKHNHAAQTYFFIFSAFLKCIDACTVN